ncbi:hypothetical protein LR48_Vigan11g060900 [Vigna angularis]|uniref:Uncharacterized protein n=1 Tax=Phaseolus angularis TaxID=3914 RepID=A0A0L9VR79_PHAAN|nr:hypothetical protein LR48_Vigan11g060900 [Vigna angularis]
MAKLDDVFQQYMQESISTQKSNEASCKRMEMQIGHFIERLEDFGVETKVNPREEFQAMITGSDKTLDEKEIERKEKEELSEKDKDVEKEREVVEREERKKICGKIKKVRGKREEKKKVREKKICVKIKKVREKEKRTRGKKKESYEKPRPYPRSIIGRRRNLSTVWKSSRNWRLKMLGGRVSTEGYYVRLNLLMGVGMTSSSGKRIKTIGSKKKERRKIRMITGVDEELR